MGGRIAGQGSKARVDVESHHEPGHDARHFCRARPGDCEEAMGESAGRATPRTMSVRAG
jgi:hypothetical protein